MNKLTNTQSQQIPTNHLKAYLAWFIATSFVFFQFFLQTSTSVVSNAWMHDFHINAVRLSNLSAAFYYSYVAMQIPVGILYDRFRAKNILMIAALLLSLGCLLLSFAKNYELAVCARVLMGIGSSFGFIGMLKVIINNFASNEFAFMLGLSEALSMGVITVSVIIFAYVLKFYSWRFTMFICGLLALIIFFAIIFFLHEQPKKEINAKFSFSETFFQVGSLIKNKQVILCSLYAFFIFALINVFTSLWGVNFITSTYGFSHELASSMISIVFIGVAIGGPFNGVLLKRFKRHTLIMKYGAFLLAITATLIIIVPGLSKLALFIVLFIGGILTSVYVQALTVVKDSTRPNVQATALAFSNTIIMSGAPLLQVLVGCLLSNNVFGLATTSVINYRLSLAILPLGMFGAFIISWFIREPINYTVVNNL